MPEDNPASLRVSSGHYRTADLILGIIFLLAGLLGGYFALAQGIRDYWLLLIVGIIGAFLLLRRSRRPS